LLRRLNVRIAPFRQSVLPPNLRVAPIGEFPSSALEIGVTHEAAGRAALRKPPSALAARPERNLL
jgi:hypothetical protein